MRWSATMCVALLLSRAAGSAQQSAATPKVWTPEQRAVQKQYAAYEKQRLQLRALAEDAFHAEMAREKAGDCPGAQSTADFNTCFGLAVDAADQHLSTYEKALATLLALEEPGVGPQTSPNVGGMFQTPAQDAAEFRQMEGTWRSFLELASAAAFHQFDGGTGGPSAELETHLGLVRDHLRQLNRIYAMTLTL